MDDKTRARITAHYDQISAITRDSGAKVEVSEFDLELLATFAWIGIYAIGEYENAEHAEMSAKCRERVKKTFDILAGATESCGGADVTDLCLACGAAIRDRFDQYLLFTVERDGEQA